MLRRSGAQTTAPARGELVVQLAFVPGVPAVRLEHDDQGLRGVALLRLEQPGRDPHLRGGSELHRFDRSLAIARAVDRGDGRAPPAGSRPADPPRLQRRPADLCSRFSVYGVAPWKRFHHAAGGGDVERLVLFGRGLRLFGDRAARRPSASGRTSCRSASACRRLRPWGRGVANQARRSGWPSDGVNLPQLLELLDAVIDVARRVGAEKVAAAHLDLQRLGGERIQQVPAVEAQRRRSRRNPARHRRWSPAD